MVSKTEAEEIGGFVDDIISDAHMMWTKGNGPFGDYLRFVGERFDVDYQLLVDAVSASPWLTSRLNHPHKVKQPQHREG
jgi:hypothetical protein